MWKKIIIAAWLLIMATAAQAQIGYKGQLAIGATAGVNQSGGLTAAVSVGGFVSTHSIIGIEGLHDRTRYNAGDNDSFHVAQWLGNIRYQYALPLGKFMLLPSGGVLLGGERCDPVSRQGNRVIYGNKFVYGLAIAFDAEYILSRHWALTIQPRMTYLINTSFDNVKVSASVGVKYYF